MSDRYYGSVYLVTPGEPDPDRMHERVVDAYDHARSHIDVVKELWSIAGDDARASAIDAIVDHAYERDLPILLAAEVDELLTLIDGLEDALTRTVVDEDLYIRPEQMAYVRQHARLIDVGEERGPLTKYGVMEGLSRVRAIRNILREARSRGLDVALD